MHTFPVHTIESAPEQSKPSLKALQEAFGMIPRDGVTMNYFSLITTVGTPQTIAAQELRVECMCPADDETEVLHATLLASASAMH